MFTCRVCNSKMYRIKEVITFNEVDEVKSKCVYLRCKECLHEMSQEEELDE